MFKEAPNLEGDMVKVVHKLVDTNRDQWEVIMDLPLDNLEEILPKLAQEDR